MNRPILDLLIETAEHHLKRLEALPRDDEHGERVEELIAIQRERLLRLLQEAGKN